MDSGQQGASGHEPVQGQRSPSRGEDAVQSGGRKHCWSQPTRHSVSGRHHQGDHGSEMHRN